MDRAKLTVERVVERVGFLGILACASVIRSGSKVHCHFRCFSFLEISDNDIGHVVSLWFIAFFLRSR